MEVATSMLDHERDYGKAVQVGIAEDLEVGAAPPARDRAADEGLLALADRCDADRLLELKDQACSNRIHDRRGAPLLTVLHVGQIDMLGWVHVGDRAATGHAGHAVVEQVTAAREQARRSGAADELVRRDEDRVEVRRGWAR